MHKYKNHINLEKASRIREKTENVIGAVIKKHFVGSDGPFLIAVGGPGGSGKSTFSVKLACSIGGTVLNLDDYKTPREERRNKNLFGAHPEANRMDHILEHLKALKHGQSVQKPVYNAVTGNANQTEKLEAARFIVVDGEISTYRAFRDLVDFSVFIDSNWKTQLNTRLTRDISERGYTREKAVATFLQSNLREFETYGAESKHWSDVHLYCKEDYQLIIESVSETVFERFDPWLSNLDVVDPAGLIVAATTPFTSKLELDSGSYIRHLEFLAEKGVSRLLVNGTTGEFYSLAREERKQLLVLARRYFPGEIFFNAGADSLPLAREEALWAEDYGADAIVALPPYYRADAPEEGLIDYFTILKDNLESPLILYNFPRHTNNPITPNILKKLSHFGLKDSSADLSLIQHTERYYIGGDRKIADCFRAGGTGFVTGWANCFPELFVAMDKAWHSHDTEQINAIQLRINEMLDAFSGDQLGAKIKTVLSSRLKEYQPLLRPPMRSCPAQDRLELVQKAKQFFP